MAAAVIGLSVAIGVALAAPRWLAVEDPLRPCPAIVVLNGEERRTDEAARLYHAGIGSEVWLTQDPASHDEAGDRGVRWSRARLVTLGVPAAAVYQVPGDARRTRAEVAVIAGALRRRALPCAVLVTSPPHARRVKATWWWVVGRSPQAVVRHAPNALHAGWAVVARELPVTLLAVAGFPR